MAELRLVTPAAEESPFSAGSPLPPPPPPRPPRHSRQPGARAPAAATAGALAEALGTHGYAGITTTHVSECANVSTSTFYKHFGNLWDCLLAAYVAAACAASRDTGTPDDANDGDRLAAGIDAALAFFADEPELGQLLSAQAPREASALCAARHILVSRLAAMLRRTRAVGDDSSQPTGLDERLIDATLVFLQTPLAVGDAERLAELGRELVAILDRPRVAA